MKSFFIINNIFYYSEASLDDLNTILENKFKLDLKDSDYGDVTILSNDISKGGKIMISATKGSEKILYFIKEKYPKAKLDICFFGKEGSSNKIDKAIKVLINNGAYDFNIVSKG